MEAHMCMTLRIFLGNMKQQMCFLYQKLEDDLNKAPVLAYVSSDAVTPAPQTIGKEDSTYQ